MRMVVKWNTVLSDLVINGQVGNSKDRMDKALAKGKAPKTALVGILTKMNPISGISQPILPGQIR